MSALRRHLAWIAAVWLTLQAGVVATSSLVGCCAQPSETASDDDACCDGMAPGQICPLHKHRHAPPRDAGQADSTQGPVLRCGCGSIDPALASLALGLGIPEHTVSLRVSFVSISVALTSRRIHARPGSLDPPPPRA